jgi:Fe-S-cluster containining protein
MDLPLADIKRCSADAGFLAAVEACYADLDRRIAARQPVCTNRGACCKFESYGHRLYVSAAELAYFVGLLSGPLWAPPDRSACPYQQEGRCTVRGARPAGCRIYFCDADAQHWQPDQTEESLRELAAIGDKWNLPYAYVEWTEALRQLGGEIREGAPAAQLVNITTTNLPV